MQEADQDAISAFIAAYRQAGADARTVREGENVFLMHRDADEDEEWVNEEVRKQEA